MAETPQDLFEAVLKRVALLPGVGFPCGCRMCEAERQRYRDRFTAAMVAYQKLPKLPLPQGSGFGGYQND
jgi:hypothetical protein